MEMSEHLKQFLGEMLASSDFSDVTIVTEDKEQFKGHRNILSAFSSVLRELFKVDSHYPSLLYLNGVNSTVIKSIMQYIYLNEIPQNWTQQLESAVKSLQIKGLMEKYCIDLNLPSALEEKDLTLKTSSFMNNSNKADKDVTGSDLIKIDMLELLRSELTKNSSANNTEDKCFELEAIETQCKQAIEIHDDDCINERLLQEEVQESRNDDNEETTEEFAEMEIPQINSKYGVEYGCKFCDYQFLGKDIAKKHMHKKHPEQSKVSKIFEFNTKYFKCNCCDFKTQQRESLAEHKKREHPSMKKKCDQCDYKPTDQSNLYKHKRAKHERIIYPCKFCEFKSNWKQTVEKHIKSVHEEIQIKVQCSQCGKLFSGKGSLSTHVQDFHEGRRYKCDFCEYHATRKSNLGIHFKKMHKDQSK